MSLKTGYSAFETRYFKEFGKDPFAIKVDYISMPYSEIKYCRPTGDPMDPPAPPSEARSTFSEYWRLGRDEAYWVRKAAR